MKIRTKLALLFTVIVAIILAVFSLSIYYLSENYRKQEFYKSLKDRALTNSQLLLKVKDIDKKLLKIIDKNTLSTLYAVEVLVFNDNNEVAYSNYDAEVFLYSPELLENIRKNRYLESTYKEKQVVGVIITDEKNNEYVVLAQAKDIYGEEKLRNIKNSMISGLFLAIILTVVFGFIFAGQALRPIAIMNKDISQINAYNLRQQLNTGNNKDEIAQLAINFNAMLARLNKSFELQKSFVSNASHELRTPLAAIKSEIQIALQQPREEGEYTQILQRLLVDNQQLIKLTNGLLQLAKSENLDSGIQKTTIRIDEILFEVQEQLLHIYSDYKINIDFEDIPEDDNSVTVKGNKQLLNTLFTNLIENACKYSTNHFAEVYITFDAENTIILIKDSGIGIPKDALDKIFEPFFRTQSATLFKGHGIGLSICKRIVDLHEGAITVKSKENSGSTFKVVLPHI